MTDTHSNWRCAMLPMTATIQEAISNLNEVAIQIVLVVNENDELEGTVSDGDIRRGLLKGVPLDGAITEILHRNPLVVPENVDRSVVLQLMTANKIHQIPIIGAKHAVMGLHLWDDIAVPIEHENLMIIMAGGVGSRLSPRTDGCPKPMLKVAGKPMLEHIIYRARQEGFRHILLAVHYLGHMIEDHFGDGSDFGVEITYLKEDAPLGTAGALSLLTPRPALPFVVTNGDVITEVRYGELLEFHQSQNAAATMAVRAHEWQHPFGVVDVKGVEIVGFKEKPVSRSNINAGIYAMDPSVLDRLTYGEECDIPKLFSRLRDEGQRTVAYPMHEPWLDLGRPEDLDQASIEAFIQKE